MLEEIRVRQSIRKYTNQPIESKKITALLKAAMRAPTAQNKQEWRFIVVEDKKTLEEISSFSPYTGMLKNASAAIIVLGDKEVTPTDAYIYVDCAAAIENILLEAVHQGIGTCWCAIGPNEERIKAYVDYFKLSDTLLPVAVIAMGYPDETKPLVDRYDETKITYWNKK